MVAQVRSPLAAMGARTLREDSVPPNSSYVSPCGTAPVIRIAGGAASGPRAAIEAVALFFLGAPLCDGAKGDRALCRGGTQWS